MTASAVVADGPVLDRWWATFRATGALPAELLRHQGRLIRAVHRGELPSGPVFVKVMAFPRAKDRLRYLLRALPGEHEARLLQHVAAAGVPCPAVVACRTARRFGLPERSMLVLRALPVAAAAEPDPLRRLQDEAELAMRLLRAGIEHRDLHTDNFVRLQSGALAVLDLQSASACGRDLTIDRRVVRAMAARLLRERVDVAAAHVECLRQAGLLMADEVTGVVRQAARDRVRYHLGRVRRCLQESTEFTWRMHWWGREHGLRSGLGDGRWWPAGRMAKRVWLGQRERQLAGESPFFRRCAQNWWWLGGGGALYVPLASDDRIQAEVQSALAGWDRLVATARGIMQRQCDRF